jgi:hypothetical protein
MAQLLPKSGIKTLAFTQVMATWASMHAYTIG